MSCTRTVYGSAGLWPLSASVTGGARMTKNLVIEDGIASLVVFQSNALQHSMALDCCQFWLSLQRHGHGHGIALHVRKTAANRDHFGCPAAALQNSSMATLDGYMISTDRPVSVAFVAARWWCCSPFWRAVASGHV